MSGPLSVQAPPASRRSTSWIANPWAQARFLWVAVFGYLAWSLVPVSRSIRQLRTRSKSGRLARK